MSKINNIFIIKLAFLFVVFCNVVIDVAHKVFLQNIAFKVFDGSIQVIWISIINALILIPFILLFTLIGYLSDKYNKKHAKAALNWQFSALIYTIISFVLIIVLIGIVLLVVIGVLNLVFSIIAAVKAGNGEVWKYPLSIKFFKV